MSEITSAVCNAVIKANTILPPDILQALRAAKEKESVPRARKILDILLLNADIAAKEQMPLCQDTGLVVIDLSIGQEVKLEGGGLEEAIQQGIREGYKKGYFRNSVVDDPFIRMNTGDNTPAIIHTHIVPGENLWLKILPKGAGSENVGALAVFKPTESLENIKAFIINTVSAAGANSCPPVIVGVGCGGNLEHCAYLAKRALLRPVDQRHERQDVAGLENELLQEINKLSIGPQGLGGDTSALAVNIEVGPTHIASLPVAVNMNCHCTRRAVIKI
jgi:fumarate hydratase subunit alpha